MQLVMPMAIIKKVAESLFKTERPVEYGSLILKLINNMEIILSLFFLILYIVMIVKFFQIASDVKEILRLISLQSRKYEPNVNSKNILVTDEIGVGSHIIELKTKRQFNVMELVNDYGTIKYLCSNNNGITSESFDRNEIELFRTYFKEQNS